MASQTYTQRLNSTANNVLTVELTETTNISNNTSTIAYVVKVVGNGLSVKNNNYLNFSLGGNTIFSGNPGTVTDSVAIASGTWTYTHNSDGTGSFPVYCYYSTILATDGSVSAEINQTHTATPIARASTITVGNGTLGTAQTITITKADSSYTHTLSYKCGNATGTIATKTTDASKSWTPPVSLAAQNTTGTSLSCTITCDTYSGNTKLGSTSKTITLSIPTSIAPTAGNITTTEKNTLPVSGVFIQGRSIIQLSCIVSTSSDQSATIKTAQFSVGGSSYSATISQSGTNWTCTYSSIYPNTAGTLNITFTATDSRGRTVTKTGSIEVYSYTMPTISGFTVTRCNSSGTATDSGTCVKVVATVNYASLNNKNTCTRTLAWSPATGSVSSKTYSTNSISEVITAYTFSADNAYQFTLTVADAFTSTQASRQILSELVTIDYHSSGTGVAIGGVSQSSNLLDIFLPTKHRDNITIDKSGVETSVTMKCGFDLKYYNDGLNNQSHAGLTDITNSRLVYTYFPSSNLFSLDVPTRVKGTLSNEWYNIGTKLDEMRYVHHLSPGQTNTQWYVCFAYIVISKAYYNDPITFHITQRDNRHGTVTVGFDGANSVDPALRCFEKTGNLRECKIVKVDTSTWRIWLCCSSYDDVSIIREDYSSFSRSECTVTYDTLAQTGDPGGTVAKSAQYQNRSVLWSGSFSSGSVSVNVVNITENYPNITVVGFPTSGSGISTVVIPTEKLTTSDQAFQIHDETNYFKFNVKKSGVSSLVFTYVSKSASGSITQIY